MASEAVEEARRLVTEAYAFRDWPGEPTRECPGCHVWYAIGPPWAQVTQFQHHWPGCRGVASMTFHPDGSLAGVVFK